MQKLFGTDGIRGHAGEFPLDTHSVQVIGKAISSCFRERLGRAPRFICGRDTRESGPEIESALIAGAEADGAECESAGVITTPGVAYLASAFGFDAGIVISASHNPYRDNGIKIFAPDGKKLDEETESAIESAIAEGKSIEIPAAKVQAHRSETFCRDYLDHLRREAGEPSFVGIDLVLDCANGAASWLAPELFRSFGANVKTINASPDGRNINLESGSTHLDHIARIVKEEKANVGIAFDGDADRVLFVDQHGSVVDGDATLWIMARYLQDQGELEKAAVVATVMSNIGLQIALGSRGIDLLRANVGDKYVLEKLLETGSVIGGVIG